MYLVSRKTVEKSESGNSDVKKDKHVEDLAIFDN